MDENNVNLIQEEFNNIELNTEEPKKKKNYKKIFLIVIAILVLSLLSFSIYEFVIKDNSKNNDNEEQLVDDQNNNDNEEEPDDDKDIIKNFETLLGDLSINSITGEFVFNEVKGKLNGFFEKTYGEQSYDHEISIYEDFVVLEGNYYGPFTYFLHPTGENIDLDEYVYEFSRENHPFFENMWAFRIDPLEATEDNTFLISVENFHDSMCYKDNPRWNDLFLDLNQEGDKDFSAGGLLLTKYKLYYEKGFKFDIEIEEIWTISNYEEIHGIEWNWYCEDEDRIYAEENYLTD